MCPNQTTEHLSQAIQHVKKVKMSATQSCLTLCVPVDCSTPGSSVCGILQARILEWGAIPFSRGCLLHCRQILYRLSYKGSPLYPLPPCPYCISFTASGTSLSCTEVLRRYLQYCIGALAESALEFKRHWQEWEPKRGPGLGTLTAQGWGSGRGLREDTGPV